MFSHTLCKYNLAYTFNFDWFTGFSDCVLCDCPVRLLLFVSTLQHTVIEKCSLIDQLISLLTLPPPDGVIDCSVYSTAYRMKNYLCMNPELIKHVELSMDKKN